MKEKIILLRKRGKTINEIVKELGCAKSTVSYHINKYGLGGKFSNYKCYSSFDFDIQSDEVQEVIRKRKLGATYDEILPFTTLSKDVVLKIFRDLNLNKGNFYSATKDLNTKDVIAKYKELKSLRKLSEYYNVDRASIRKIIPDEIVRELNPKHKSDKARKKAKKKAVIDWRRRTKEKLVEYKGSECELCGYKKSIQVLQFHHTDPTKKDFSISGKSYSFERMKKEVDKCVLVCANCHIEIHEKERNK